jgi:hypothetical protein
MKPYQLPPDPWISSIWVWWVMLQSGASSWCWWLLGVRPCQFSVGDCGAGWKFGTYQQNLTKSHGTWGHEVMKPYQLPQKPWISPIWVWWVMLQSGASSWLPMGSRPCQFLGCGWLNYAHYQQKQINLFIFSFHSSTFYTDSSRSPTSWTRLGCDFVSWIGNRTDFAWTDRPIFPFLIWFGPSQKAE